MKSPERERARKFSITKHFVMRMSLKCGLNGEYLPVWQSNFTNMTKHFHIIVFISLILLDLAQSMLSLDVKRQRFLHYSSFVQKPWVGSTACKICWHSKTILIYLNLVESFHFPKTLHIFGGTTGTIQSKQYLVHKIVSSHHDQWWLVCAQMMKRLLLWRPKQTNFLSSSIKSKVQNECKIISH